MHKAGQFKLQKDKPTKETAQAQSFSYTKMLLFQIKNNTVIAEANPTPQDGAIPQFYQDQAGWIRGYVEEQSIQEFEYFSGPRYKQKNGKWYRYHTVLELSLADAKAQKRKQIKEAFRQDILWTDEELQFYQKRKRRK